MSATVEGGPNIVEFDAFDPSCSSPDEAPAAPRPNLNPRGLVMGQISQGSGPTVAAQTGSAGDDRPMFYAASAMEYIDEVKDRLGEQLADLALQKAREEGRTLVTRDDFQATIERFGATLLKESAEDVGP